MIRVKRGQKENLPTGYPGEPLMCLDTGEFYVGGNHGNVLINGPWVTPEAYGARGDGVHDDTAAIQAAINAAGARSTGRCVVFGSTSAYYRCASSITVNYSFITLLGFGYSGIVFDGNGFVISANVHDVAFDGIIINGNVLGTATGTVGINVSGSGGIGVQGLVIKNCYFERWGSRGDATGACIKIASDTNTMNISDNVFSLWGRGIDITSTVDSGWICHNNFGQEAGAATDWAISVVGSVGSINLNIIGNNCVASGGFITCGSSTPALYAGGVNILYNEYENLPTNPDVSNAKKTVYYLNIGLGYNLRGNYIGVHSSAEYCIYVEPFVSGMGIAITDSRLEGVSVADGGMLINGIYNHPADVNYSFYANNRMLDAEDNETLLYATPDATGILYFDQGVRTSDAPAFDHLYVPGTTEKVTDGGLEDWSDATHLVSWVEDLAGGGSVNQATGAGNIRPGTSGTSACRIDVDASNNGASIAQVITLTADLPHKLTFWYKTEAGKNARALFTDSAANVYLGLSGIFQTSPAYLELVAATSWTEYTLNFITHASYTSYALAFLSYESTSSSIYFDDVSVVSAISLGGDNSILDQDVTTTAGPTFDHLHLTTGPITVAGAQVVGARVVDARANDVANSGDATTDGLIDALRDAMIAHGLLAAA